MPCLSSINTLSDLFNKCLKPHFKQPAGSLSDRLFFNALYSTDQKSYYYFGLTISARQVAGPCSSVAALSPMVKLAP